MSINIIFAVKIISRKELSVQVEQEFDSNIGCSPILRKPNIMGRSPQIRVVHNGS